MSLRYEAPAGRRSLRSSSQPIVEARDLYRIPLWLLQKASYSYAPISFHFRLAAAKGTLDWVSVQRRTRLMETLEAHVGKTTSRRELRRIARRHLQALRKGDFTMIWPQVHNLAGVEAIGIEGLKHLDEALGRGKGAILVSAHFGFERMIKPVLRSRGRRVQFRCWESRSAC